MKDSENEKSKTFCEHSYVDIIVYHHSAITWLDLLGYAIFPCQEISGSMYVPKYTRSEMAIWIAILEPIWKKILRNYVPLTTKNRYLIYLGKRLLHAIAENWKCKSNWYLRKYVPMFGYDSKM